MPGVNNDGGFGRWVFVEVTDVAAVKSDIREAVSAVVQETA